MSDRLATNPSGVQALRYLLPVQLIDRFVRQLDGRPMVIVTLPGYSGRLLIPLDELVVDVRPAEVKG